MEFGLKAYCGLKIVCSEIVDRQRIEISKIRVPETVSKMSYSSVVAAAEAVLMMRMMMMMMMMMMVVSW